jgi:hypothetical protein
VALGAATSADQVASPVETVAPPVDTVTGTLRPGHGSVQAWLCVDPRTRRQEATGTDQVTVPPEPPR